MHPAGDVRKGEALVKTLYEAIRGSTLWLSSMFVIVFDAGCCEPSASSGQLCARTAARKVPRQKSRATWSGRGPAPAWFAAVKDRTKFLIVGTSGGTAANAWVVAKKGL
jgi:hypothetical protein